MVQVFVYGKTGSLFVMTEDCGFFLDKDGEFMPETGFRREMDFCEKLSSQLVFLKKESLSQLRLYMQQPIVLSSVAE